MSEDKKGKPTYQTPKVMPLGELAKGEGQACHNGGSASDCSYGTRASNNCNMGGTAGQQCNPFGSTAGQRCRFGTNH
jgi:hypothetical protein